MQTGSLDAAVTSSTSLISFRLEEISKAVTSGSKGSFWFMLEPLLMSKSIYDGLPADQQKVISEVGASLEAFALERAKADDNELAKVFSPAGAKVAEFDAPALQKWKRDRPRYRVEGFRRAQRRLRRAAEAGREGAGMTSASRWRSATSRRRLASASRAAPRARRARAGAAGCAERRDGDAVGPRHCGGRRAC